MRICGPFATTASCRTVPGARPRPWSSRSCSRFNDDNPNGAAVRFLIDGAPVPADADAYQRIVLIFDGEDPEAVAAARERWSEGRAKGFDVAYWQADEQGRWRRMG